jgi:hypothetical protein
VSLLVVQTVERLHKVPLPAPLPSALSLVALPIALSLGVKHVTHSSDLTTAIAEDINEAGSSESDHQARLTFWSPRFWRFVLSRSTYSGTSKCGVTIETLNDTLVRCDVSTTTFGAYSEVCC